MTKGERIKFLRESAGISQEVLGQMLGTTKQTIYKYEMGIITNIPSDKIEQMAQIFDTTPIFLMGWEDEQPAGLSTDELDEELINRLLRLSPEELSRVDAFVQGLLASR